MSIQLKGLKEHQPILVRWVEIGTTCIFLLHSGRIRFRKFFTVKKDVRVKEKYPTYIYYRSQPPLTLQVTKYPYLLKSLISANVNIHSVFVSTCVS